MIDTALELAAQAASSYLFIFCFCNLIIVIILLASKPPPSSSDERQVSLPTITSKCTIDEAAMKIEDTVHTDRESQRKESVEKGEDITHSDSNIVIVHDDCNFEDDGDDELTARIEDFIAKVNREWQAEKMRARALS